MNSLKTMEDRILDAIQKRIKDIADEECVAAMDRIKSRITADCVDLAPMIIKGVSWPMGEGEVTIKFKTR